MDEGGIGTILSICSAGSFNERLHVRENPDEVFSKIALDGLRRVGMLARTSWVHSTSLAVQQRIDGETRTFCCATGNYKLSDCVLQRRGVWLRPSGAEGEHTLLFEGPDCIAAAFMWATPNAIDMLLMWYSEHLASVAYVPGVPLERQIYPVVQAAERGAKPSLIPRDQQGNAYLSLANYLHSRAAAGRLVYYNSRTDFCPRGSDGRNWNVPDNYRRSALIELCSPNALQLRELGYYKPDYSTRTPINNAHLFMRMLKRQPPPGPATTPEEQRDCLALTLDTLRVAVDRGMQVCAINLERLCDQLDEACSQMVPAPECSVDGSNITNYQIQTETPGQGVYPLPVDCLQAEIGGNLGSTAWYSPALPRPGDDGWQLHSLVCHAEAAAAEPAAPANCDAANPDTWARKPLLFVTRLPTAATMEQIALKLARNAAALAANDQRARRNWPRAWDWRLIRRYRASGYSINEWTEWLYNATTRIATHA